MNTKDERYTKWSLVNEMMETPAVVRGLDLDRVFELERFFKREKLFFTGEGSSRIFPAKKCIADALAHDYEGRYATEAATQALEYDLSKSSVFVASNSGKTKEGVRLIRTLKSHGHRNLCGVVATPGTPIHLESDGCYLLSCGPERAVAATKSVVEQALFYDLNLRKAHRMTLPDLKRLGDLVEQALETRIPPEIVARLCEAETLYWAGRNNGVAEELTLKSNEIARKKSDFLEGTYAVHGIEEVMKKGDAVIIIEPFPDEEEKFEEVLEKGIGLQVVALSSVDTRFETVRLPAYDEFSPYIQLAAGWNLLVEIGTRLGINLDKAERARKIGNEFNG